MIIHGTVQGGGRKGRQKKEMRRYNISEWIGLKVGEAL